ncbi:hypothetical protein GSF67_12925 [Agrobacterium sp. CGMCC 11546]|nr:hypothetical protein GSF67_12925 [Agrobacterium sp. CGMCC 11546]
MGADRQRYFFLALRLQRHQFPQPVRERHREFPGECHGTGPAPHPPHSAQSRRYRHFADHPAADHLLHPLLHVEHALPDDCLSGLWRKHDDHVRLSVRLTPNGGRDAIDGVEQDADGNAHLKARVSAVPEGGKANKALIVLLAKKLGLPKSSITFISGETARKKILRIDTDPEDFEKLFKKLAG